MQIPGTSWGIYDVSVKWRLSITDMVLLVLVVIAVALLKRKRRRNVN